MRDSIKRKIHRLIHAINEALTDSEELTDSVEGVRDEGYDLFLILEATVVLNREGDMVALDTEEWDEEVIEDAGAAELEDAEVWLPAVADATEGVELSTEISDTDHEFLRTLGIRLEG